MEGEKKHWVEELFTPHFTVQDLFLETLEPELLSERLARERAKKTEGIYQAALGKLQEAEKQRRKEHLSNLIVQEAPAAAQCSSCASCQKLSHSTSVDGPSTPCIWSERELKLLRKEMQEKHAEESQLKLHLNACKLELSQLQAKQKRSEEDLEAAWAELSATKRAGKCKGVLLQQIQKDSAQKDAELQSLKRELHEYRLKTSNLTNSLSKANREILDLQLHNRDLEQDLHKLKQQQGLHNVFTIESMNQKFSRKVNHLRGEIDAAKAEEEKQSYLLRRDDSVTKRK
ncbi:coiled-coil domain-containing protein 160 [Gastrophryne carolinensis]